MVSLTQRRLVLIVISVAILAMLVSFYSIKSIVDTVDNGLKNSDFDLIFSAIEAGPLEFARQYSGEFSDSQLKILIEKSNLRARNVVAAKIYAGEPANMTYAEWVDSKQLSKECVQEYDRVYKFKDAVFPFHIVLTVDLCSDYLLTKSLSNKIIAAFSFATFIAFLSGILGLLPLFKATKAAYDLLKNYNEDESSKQASRILYQPVRELAELAIKSIKLEKFRTLAQAAQHIAHDLRAPLGTFERLLYIQANEFEFTKSSITESLNRIYAMIESFRYSDLEIIVRRSLCHVNFEVGLEGISRKAIERGVRIVFPRNEKVEALVDPLKFERAWVNLVSNAIEVAKSKVKIELEKKGSSLCLKVIDDGPGVPEEILPKLFQRGVTFGKTGGTGFGLAYVKQVMMGHGGDVKYYREKNETVFECYIPNAINAHVENNDESVSMITNNKEVYIKKVGICFEPEKLAEEIIAELTICKVKDYQFEKGFSTEFDIIVTNSLSIVEKSVESGINVIEFQKNSDINEIKRKILKRLGIKVI